MPIGAWRHLLSWLQRGMLVVYSCALLWTYSSRINPDFQVFFDAAVRLRRGLPLYEQGTAALPYVNGPLLSAILSPLTPLGPASAARVWVLLSFAAVILLAWLLTRAVSRPPAWTWLVSGLLVASFPVRNTLGNGQVGVVVVTGLAVAWSIVIWPRPLSRGFDLLVGALTYVALEFKPYLMVIPVIALAVMRRTVAVATAVCLVALSNALLWLSASDATWVYWVRAITHRQASVADEFDQSSIFAVLTSLTAMPAMAAGLAQLAVCGALVYVTFRLPLRGIDEGMPTAKFAAWVALIPLLSPYAHQQDWVFSLVALMLVVTSTDPKRFRSVVLMVSLALCLSWGNPSIGLGLLTIAMFGLSLALMDYPIRRAVVVCSGALLLQLIQAAALSRGGWEAQYHVNSIAALAFGLSVWTVAFVGGRQDGESLAGQAGPQD